MLIEYARVSTDAQNLGLQRDALRQAGREKIREGHISDAKASLRDWRLPGDGAGGGRPGNFRTVWPLDRLGRSLHDLITLIQSRRTAR